MQCRWILEPAAPLLRFAPAAVVALAIVIASPKRLSAVPASEPITAPLKVLAGNPHYFGDASGRAVFLTGSQTWNTFQDWGTNGTVQPIDFSAFVNMLLAHNHNFTLLWATELPTFRSLPSTEKDPPDFTVAPHPWLRTGPGKASDGNPKFDLSRFNQGYFDRLRDRVRQLNSAGIYAGVYFFTGEWLNSFRFSADGYPLSGGNNVNGVDDGGGTGAVTMTAPNAVTAVQDAYVKKVIDTLNDLPNVLWIVSEEAPANSGWWNNHLIALARAYEEGKPLRHPIGYASTVDFSDATLLDSDADWIAPAARISPTISRGRGRPAFKVNINDSDHSYWGIWNDSPQVNRNYFWINFTNGNQTLFMDPYVLYYPRQNRNLSPAPVNGISPSPDHRWDNVRDTMGFIRAFANRIDLAAMTPHGELASTGHALATLTPGKAEILVYAPSGGFLDVDLSGLLGNFAVEWLNPANGARTQGPDIVGGDTRTFPPPFDGDSVLFLSSKAPGGAAAN
jgi:hypothetical protein